MILYVLLVVNDIFTFSAVSNAHDNSEQHAIVHSYPLLELEYMKAEENECKMGILERSYCNSNSSNDEKNINK